jgi:hypothetical protein
MQQHADARYYVMQQHADVRYVMQHNPDVIQG